MVVWLTSEASWAAPETEYKLKIRETELGAVTGLFYVFQDPGVAIKDGRHLFGGFVNGGELGFKWRVAEKVRVGFTIALMVGYMSHRIDAMSWSAGDTHYAISYENYVSGLLPSAFVLDLWPTKWLFFEGRIGFILPIDRKHEPMMYFAAGGGVGVSFLNHCIPRPYIRAGFTYAHHRSDFAGGLPTVALGIRF
ncbi:MAG: hypothetical protein QNJ97_05975 [Myxococcota bacterium]|nr:hypothetical protein [Myxococcota bacterium]